MCTFYLWNTRKGLHKLIEFPLLYIFPQTQLPDQQQCAAVAYFYTHYIPVNIFKAEMFFARNKIYSGFFQHADVRTAQAPAKQCMCHRKVTPLFTFTQPIILCHSLHWAPTKYFFYVGNKREKNIITPVHILNSSFTPFLVKKVTLYI